MDIGVIFGQMLVLLAMMALGYFSYKKSWVTDDTAGHLSKLVVNIFNPILVVNGVLGQNSADAGADVVWNILFMVLYFVILLVVGFLLPALLRPEKSHKNIYRLMTIFSNVGFMGIPVIKSILGDEAMIYVAFYILGYNIMLYTVGMFLAQ
ncbi:MAG: AEC family transporter, partial [Lachnospiraceae bacterium]|nr:AEC family transporter [Lachnospiraceae bacterium]